ncbi:hypothetical protein [Trichocoleus sp. FACHB-262]|uniref:hypothetical protein n=2 Tax=Trichocoleus TaxID=450526 RepID=UPI001685AE74|nr:hypothetical protein [Trichocoleus sp. FACHB-262]MBD2120252.1 hypothetical protein [Trichocoleus sp. FACHB-262]
MGLASVYVSGLAKDSEHQRRRGAIASLAANFSGCLNPELIALQEEEGAAYGAAILAMVEVGAYPNLTTALKIVLQEQSVVQPQANVVYKEAFQRYPLLYEALKAIW